MSDSYSICITMMGRKEKKRRGKERGDGNLL
jgi:hypothetical protein